jgi:DNA-binding HxlR family transcriptional regulator
LPVGNQAARELRYCSEAQEGGAGGGCIARAKAAGTECIEWDARNGCEVREILDRVADKWSLLAIAALEQRTLRFSELQRWIDGSSQRMLTVTLRQLERDGLVCRRVYPVFRRTSSTPSPARRHAARHEPVAHHVDRGASARARGRPLGTRRTRRRRAGACHRAALTRLPEHDARGRADERPRRRSLIVRRVGRTKGPTLAEDDLDVAR